MGLGAGALLALVLVPLAAPGVELVPGAAGDPDPPGWLLGPFGDGFGLGGGAYLALLYVAFVAYLGVAWAAPDLGRRLVWSLFGFGLVLFALAPPLLSLDVFSYISYGSLQVEGLNPYEVAPEAIPANEAAARVDDFSDAVSVYGPVFSLISYPLAGLGVPAALWAMKGLAALSALGLVALSAKLATARGISAERVVALVGLNPIVLVHGVGGAHNDVLMALGMVATGWLLVTSRPVVAGVAVTAAVAVKAAGALIAPFALLGARSAGSRGRFLAGALVGAFAVALVALAVYGTAAVEALDVLGSSQERISRYSVPATLARATGLDVETVRAAAIVAFLGLVAIWLWRVGRGADPLRGAAWAALGLLLATAYMTPWYLLWALPLAAISRDRALVALMLAFSAFQLVNSIPL